MTDQKNPTRLRMVFHAFIALAIVGAALIGVSILFATSPEVSPRQRPARRATFVEVSDVKTVTHPLAVASSGLSIPAQQLDVIPQVRGKIVSVNKDLIPGKVIKKGQTLATIERRDYVLAVKRAETAIAQAKANLALETGNQELAKLEAGYLEDLVNDDNKDLVLRKPQLATANAQLAAAQVELAQAQLNLRRTRLVAPFDALVQSRDVAVGRTVTEASSIASLASVDEWWISAEVAVSNLSRLTPGSAVTVAFPDAWGETTRTGTLIQNSGQIESRGRLGSVLVSVKDPLAREQSDAPPMLLGTRYDVQLSSRTLESAVLAEPGWIRGENEVWLMNEAGKLETRVVEIAYRDSKQAVIAGGLKAGERIITSRLASPVEGMALRAGDEKPKPAAKEGKR